MLHSQIRLSVLCCIDGFAIGYSVFKDVSCICLARRRRLVCVQFSLVLCCAIFDMKWNRKNPSFAGVLKVRIKFYHKYRGRILSMLNWSVQSDALPPPARKSADRRTSPRTRLRVSSRAEIYGWIGRFKISWFGLMPARLMRSKIDFCSSLRGLRLPKAVMGSAMRLGRGTVGTLSQFTSRLWNVCFFVAFLFRTFWE